MNFPTMWYVLRHEGMCDQQMLRPDCANAQSGQSLCLLLEYLTNIKLLNEHHYFGVCQDSLR